MSRKEWYVAIGAGLLLLLLLRKKAAAAAAPLEGGFSPLGIASIYFDPGQSFTVNANTNSPSFGQTLSAN